MFIKHSFTVCQPLEAGNVAMFSINDGCEISMSEILGGYLLASFHTKLFLLINPKESLSKMVFWLLCHFLSDWQQLLANKSYTAVLQLMLSDVLRSWRIITSTWIWVLGLVRFLLQMLQLLFALYDRFPRLAWWLFPQLRKNVGFLNR